MLVALPRERLGRLLTPPAPPPPPPPSSATLPAVLSLQLATLPLLAPPARLAQEASEPA
jgi:hypothetical protein